MKTGILALQGDYLAHGRVLDKLGREYNYVRTPAELGRTDSLIIPGGESTTIRKLARKIDLWEPLKSYDKPILGTCAGIILLAARIDNPPEETLNKLDITVSRNAYGSQINSFIDDGELVDPEGTIEMVFIRAPKITEVGKQARALAKHGDDIVGVIQGSIIGLTFHPELSNDTSIYEIFLSLVADSKTKATKR